MQMQLGSQRFLMCCLALRKVRGCAQSNACFVCHVHVCAAQEERRRAQNLAARQEKESMLLDKVANIQRVRKVAAVQAQSRRAKTKEESAAAEAATATKHETGVLVLHESLEAKRAAAAAEKARIAAEVKKIRFEQMQAAAGAAAVEEAKFRELREGARREVVERQAYRLQVRCTALYCWFARFRSDMVCLRNGRWACGHGSGGGDCRAATSCGVPYSLRTLTGLAA